jgi:hypothetical protein
MKHFFLKTLLCLLPAVSFSQSFSKRLDLIFADQIEMRNKIGQFRLNFDNRQKNEKGGGSFSWVDYRDLLNTAEMMERKDFHIENEIRRVADSLINEVKLLEAYLNELKKTDKVSQNQLINCNEAVSKLKTDNSSRYQDLKTTESRVLQYKLFTFSLLAIMLVFIPISLRIYRKQAWLKNSQQNVVGNESNLSLEVTRHSITKLNSMLEQGIITTEQFEAFKNQIILKFIQTDFNFQQHP